MLAGLAAAAAAGLTPVKVNAVLMRGINDHEAVALLRFCLDRGYQLRSVKSVSPYRDRANPGRRQ